MPYIDKEDRYKYDVLIHQIAALVPDEHTKRPGEINYIISKLMKKIYGYDIDRPLRYWAWNELRGAMENAISEIYRRYVGPYEDQAITKNGDI